MNVKNGRSNAGRIATFALVLTLLGLIGSASAQMFRGTFSAMGRYGLVELVFHQDGTKLKGVLTGNDLSFDLVGEVAADDPGFAYGTITAPDLEQAFEAYTDGQHLELYVIGLLPDGELDLDNVSLLEFDLASKASPDPAPADATPAPPAAAGGNPLAGPPVNPLAAAPTNPLASRAPFAGGWSDGRLILELLPQGGAYTGWLDFQGARYPVEAVPRGDALEGTFTAGAAAYPFTAALIDGGLALESDGARYELVPLTEHGTSPAQGPAAAAAPTTTAPGVPAGSAAVSGSGEVIASTAYGQLTRDGALAFIEALEFVLAELGDTQALAGVSEEEIVDALAANFPALDPESQQALANAREIWAQTRQTWAYSDMATRQEFAYAVLTIAYGEQAARSALGVGPGPGGGGGGPIGMPSPDAHIQEQTNGAASCWAAAGCDSYDPVSDDFTFETPDGY